MTSQAPLCAPYRRIALLLIFAFLCLALPSNAKDFATQAMEATYKLFNKDSTATGFLVKAPDAKPNEVILVTANHVLAKMTGDTAIIVLRKPQTDGSYQRSDFTFPIRKDNKPLWAANPAQDAAALRLTLPDDASVTPLPLTALATEEAIAANKLHIASPVIVLGYPSRFEANSAGFPVARHGSLASFPLIPIKPYPTFLVDFATFAGDSGGPVFVKDSRAGDDETAPPLLLGLVLSQIRNDERIESLYEERVIHFPMQLSNVLQAGFIRETIDILPK